MIRKQRPTFSSAELELQLQQVWRTFTLCCRSRAHNQITLDNTSSGAENLEALGPLIKSIQDSDSEQLYLRSLDKFVEEKEGEIEKICSGNYEVGTLCGLGD
jgi:hypothetical protein